MERVLARMTVHVGRKLSFPMDLCRDIASLEAKDNLRLMHVRPWKLENGILVPEDRCFRSLFSNLLHGRVDMEIRSIYGTAIVYSRHPQAMDHFQCVNGHPSKEKITIRFSDQDRDEFAKIEKKL